LKPAKFVVIFLAHISVLYIYDRLWSVRDLDHDLHTIFGQGCFQGTKLIKRCAALSTTPPVEAWTLGGWSSCQCGRDVHQPTQLV